MLRRPLYFTELAAQAFPLGLIGCVLGGYKGFLQTMCFQDNEVGDVAKASAAYQDRIIHPVNRLLQRNRKPLRLDAISVDPGRHHTIQVEFASKIGHAWQKDAVRISLFLASKKAMAMERKAEADGEEYTVVAPRRGVAPVKRVKNRKRRPKAQKACALA